MHKVGMVRMPSQRRQRVATRRDEATAAAAAAEGTAAFGWMEGEEHTATVTHPGWTTGSLRGT